MLNYALVLEGNRFRSSRGVYPGAVYCRHGVCTSGKFHGSPRMVLAVRSITIPLAAHGKDRA